MARSELLASVFKWACRRRDSTEIESVAEPQLAEDEEPGFRQDVTQWRAGGRMIRTAPFCGPGAR
jgi:hypothetical protein